MSSRSSDISGSTVRNADVSDAEAIARIHVRSWQVAYRGMMPDSLLDNLSVQDRTSQWHKRLADREEPTLVAEIDGKIEGWATFGQSRDDAAGIHTGEVYGIYLDPAAWSKGLGTLLYQEVEKRLREGGFAEATLWVLGPNVRARGFYSAVGFSADGTVRTKLRAGVEAPEVHIRYRKVLGDSPAGVNIQLRQATTEDYAFIREVYFKTQRWIIEQLFGWHGDDFENTKFDSFYEMPRTQIIEVDGQPIGWLSILEEREHLEPDGLYIMAEFQNRGIGTLLMQRLIQNARLARKQVALSTAKINPARRLYERLGFETVSEDEYKVYMRLGTVNIRALEPSDWEAFREIRLHALRTEPGFFSSSYAREIKSLPADWQALTTGDDRHQLFGLFDDKRLVGITAVFTWRDDPTGETAIFAMSYIRPEYRQRGLSRLFYETRLTWVKSKPQFTRITVSHRLSNEISKRANQRFGFRMIGTEPATWPDGSSEDEVLYELALDDG